LKHEAPRKHCDFVAAGRLYAEFEFVDVFATETAVPWGTIRMIGGRHEWRSYRRRDEVPITERSPELLLILL
jgi:hypothetical protein